MQEQPLTFGRYKLLLFTDPWEVYVIVVWLCWPVGLGRHSVHHIQQKHGVYRVCGFPRGWLPLHANLHQSNVIPTATLTVGCLLVH